MKDDIRDIAAYYDFDPEKEHERLSVHQLEYDLTLRILARYLPVKGNLLEIGAATGRYTLPLVEQGYALTAMDLSHRQIRFCQGRLREAGLIDSIHFMVSDARCLSLKKEQSYDAALLMGPLYHLIEFEDRQRALREVFNRLKPEGMIFSAFISRFGIMGDLMKNIPDWIEKGAEVDSILEEGRDTYHESEGFRGYFATVDEITPLHESMGFDTVALLGVEPAISADDESYNRLEVRQRELWLDLFERISGEPSILGASRHLLYIGKKQ